MSDTQPTSSARRITLIVASSGVALAFGWLLLGWALNSPAKANVRALADAEATTRDEAARSLVGVARTSSEFSDVIDALIAAQEDASATVRISALNSLVANFVHVRGRGDESPMTGIAASRLEDAKACLLKALRDPDDSVRGMAVASVGVLIGGAGEPLPRDAWVCLEDKSEFVRSNAASSLKDYKKGGDVAVPALLRVFEVQTGAARTTFDQAISQLKLTAASLPTLEKALASPSNEQRWLAARLIGQVGPDAAPALPALIALLRSESRTRLTSDGSKPAKSYNDPAAAAAWSIAAVGSKLKKTEAAPAIQALRDALTCGETTRISAAAGALARFGSEAVDAVPALRAELNHPRWAKSQDGSVALALASITKGTKWQPEVITLLGEAWRTADRRREVGLASALKSLGPDAIKAYPSLKSWTAPGEDTGNGN